MARAIFESALPVVSAVGHEIDFTISDFVADLRAATPSAAAEIITEGVFASGEFVAEAAGRLRQLAGQQMEDKRYELAQVAQRLARVHPRRRLNDWLQRLDDVQAGLLRCVAAGGAAAAAGVADAGGAAGAGAAGGGAAAAARGVWRSWSGGCGSRRGGNWRRGGAASARSKAGCGCWGRSRCWRAVIRSRWMRRRGRCCARRRRRRPASG